MKRIVFSLLLAFSLVLVSATMALAETGPQWTVSAVSRPTNFAPAGGAGGNAYVVLVTNTGSAASVGPVTVTDELPEGLAAAPGVSAEDELAETLSPGSGDFSKDCETDGDGNLVSCAYGGVVAPGDTLILRLPVRVLAGAPASVTNVVRVSGGGAAAPGAMRTETAISASPAGFGVSSGGAVTALSSVQAGAHPDVTTMYALNTESSAGATVENLKDIVTYEPPGLSLDLADTPACPGPLFLSQKCPVATQVGVTTAIADQGGPSPLVYLEPVYNLAPEPGEIGKIGFFIGQFHYVGDISVRPPGEAGAYGGRVTFYNLAAGVNDVDGGSLTIWGVPAAAVHDPLRFAPSTGAGVSLSPSGLPSDASEKPFVTTPTRCQAAPLEAQFRVTSWQHPEEGENPFDAETESMPFGPLSGCDRLLLEPSLSAEATSDSADAATGFDLATRLTQTFEDPEGLSTSTLQKEVVTLPEGMTINPSSGAGLSACSEAQYAEEGVTERTAQERDEGSGCPNSSKLATVRIKTPLLEEEAVGSVFIATPAPRGEQGQNPFDSLLALYLIARIPGRGVLIKAPGLVQAGEATGRLTTTFGLPNALEPSGTGLEGGLPPLPFSIATFQFNQGANAPLVTPPACGQYTVTASLTGWSDPEQALTPPLSPFAITTGAGGGPCPAGGTPPFDPQVVSYPLHANAGAYSPLYLKIERHDGEQEITGFSTQLPPGLTANLSGAQECSEEDVARARAQSGAEAEASPACPAGSEIGRTVAEAGVGSVLAQTPGRIYLGGPYNGRGSCAPGAEAECAPFSVVAVTSAHVGPFDLGTVVVHLPLEIDPETAVVTIPAGPADQIPHIIKGIVIHLRAIRVYIERPSFMLNPTSCGEAKLSATVIGSGSDSTAPVGNFPVTVSDPFQTADCQALRFEPKFSASTQGHTSKADGASLHVSLAYPAGALTSDANIRYVKVELPKALPSRLTTLQKACTQAQFRANPAGCPAASVIGHAVAHTPILPVPLEGPVYFVSNGGEAFPNLIMVLQGDGVRIDLVGDTYISSSGITSSTFKAVPDQPVESFELTLPEGPYSALGTNKDLCKPTATKIVKEKVKVKAHGHTRTVTRKVRKTVAEPLTMPTEFIAQNGATFDQTTHISVSGCPKAKAAKKRSKGKRGRKGGK